MSFVLRFLLLMVVMHGLPAVEPQVASGEDFHLFLDPEGTVWAWGNNEHGQLGDGTTTTRSTPSRVQDANGDLKDVIAVAAGGDYNGSGGGSFALALKADGSVWAWGNNAYGQLGDNSTTTRTRAVQVTKNVGNLTGIIGIAVGLRHSLAVSSDGKIWAWGSNGNGQFGDNTTTSSLVAKAGGTTLANILSVASGGYHTLALRADGTVWAWGTNTNGELGNTTTTASLTPVQVKKDASNFLTDVMSISGGRDSSMALDVYGAVWTWGSDGYGEIGNGSGTTANMLDAESVLTGIKAISCGLWGHKWALHYSGTLYAWGYNGDARSGLSTSANTPSPTLVTLPAGAVVKSISAGRSGGSTFLAANGQVYQCGNSIFSPQLVNAPWNMTLPARVATGFFHSLILKSDGTVWATGYNANGQLGDGTVNSTTTAVQVRNADNTVLSNIIDVAAGVYHSVALAADGKVWCWGYNAQGQLGDGTVASRSYPVQAYPVARSIAAGWYQSYAGDYQGYVAAWGYNAYGAMATGDTTDAKAYTYLKTAAGATLTNHRAIAGGLGSTLVILGNGEARGAGNNGFGGLGNSSTVSTTYLNANPGLTSVKAIAGGAYHSGWLLAGGTARSAGYNSEGQLGDNSRTDSTAPVIVRGTTITTLTGIKALAFGAYHGYALIDNGKVRAWGDNSFAQLGDTTSTDALFATTAKGAGGLDQQSVAQIAANYNHGVILVNNGNVRGVGSNDNGQLGKGDTTQVNAFTTATATWLPTVNVTASDDKASETGGFGTGTYTLARTGSTTLPLNVTLSWTGDAGNGTDYTTSPTGTVVAIPAEAATTTITLTAVNDAFQETAETATLRGAVAQSYLQGTSGAVAIASEDSAGTLVSLGSLTIRETTSGSVLTSATSSITLTSQPTATVSIGLTSGDTSEYTVSPSSLVFDGSNWSTAQVITVTRVDDDVADGPITAILTTGATASGDPNYNGLTVADISVTVQDDDAKGLVFSQASVDLVEGLADATYSVRLQSEPTGNVTVAITPSDAVLGVTVSPSTLSFTTSNWSTPQTVTASAVQDDWDEADAIVTLAHAASGADYGTVTGSVSANVADDDATPTFSLDYPYPSEGDGAITFTFSLSGMSAGTITVPYATGASSTTQVTTTLAGAIDETQTTCQVADATGIVPGLTLRLENEDLRITAVSGTTLTVVRGVNSSAPVAHGDGITAVAGDLVPVSGTLTYAPGESGARAITVPLFEDDLNEYDEYVYLDVSGVAVGGGHPSLSSTSVSSFAYIADNDAQPVLEITDTGGTPQSAVTVTEGDAGSATTTLRLLLSAPSGRNVTAYYSYFGSADGADYTAPAGPVSLTPGMQSFDIPITFSGDVLDEDDETVYLSLYYLDGASFGSVSTSVVTITDDDAQPAMTLGFYDAAVNPVTALTEGETGYVGASLSTISGRTVYGQIQVTGTVNGSDVTMSSYDLSLPVGGVTQLLALTLVDDALNEGDETLTVSVAWVLNADAPLASNLTVTDNDPLPSIDLSLGASAVAEAGGTATLTATLSAVSGRAVTVPLSFLGTASHGADYAPTATDITITAGNLTGSIDLTAFDDDLYEGDEVITCTINGPINGVVGLVGSVDLTITEDETQPTVSVSAASITEAGDVAYNPADPTTYTTLSVPITLSGKVQGAVTVQIDTGAPSAGTPATEGLSGDYLALVADSVTWPVGETGTRYVDVRILGNDNSQEFDETIGITLSNLTGLATYGTASTDLTIQDDDVPGLAVSTTQMAVTEGLTSGVLQAQINTTPSPLASVTVTVVASSQVEVSTSGGVGTFLPSITLSYGVGDVPQSIYVQAVDDNVDEPDGHLGTLTLTCSNTSDYTSSMTATIDVVITDNDAAPVISIDPVTTRTEPAGSSGSSGSSIGVTLDRASTSVITVLYSGTTGTAGAGDFTVTAGTLTFPANTTSGTFPITLFADALDEANETFTVSLSGAVNGVIDATNGTRTVTIADNADDAPPTVGFTTATATVAEGASATATLALSAASGRDVQIPFTIGGSGAGDATVTASPVTIAAGATTVALTIAASDDAEVEPSQAVTLTIGTPVNATAAGTTVHTTTITDTDTGVVTLSGTVGLSVTEPAGSVGYTVVLGAKPASNVTLALTSDNSRATVAPATLTFTSANWNVPQTATITVVDDEIDNGNANASITTVVTGPGTYQGLSVAAVTFTINDEDVPGFVVDATTLRVEEGATGTVQVRLRSQPTATITLPITLVAGGSFLVGDELTASAASLVFTTSDWQSDHPLTVTALNDAIDDGERLVTIDFGVPSGDATYAALTATDVAVTTVDDDNAGIVVSPLNGLTTTESGGVALFTVRLDAQPTADVTIALASSDAEEGLVSPASLTFTSANYQTAQIATITGQEDSIDDGDTAFAITVAATGAVSADTAYQGIEGSSVNLTSIDNDTASVLLSATSLALTEASGAGQSGTYTVRLATEPVGTVTVTFTVDAQVTVSPASLTFTTAPSGSGSWTLPQTVTVTAVADLIAEGAHTGLVTHQLASDAPGDAYQGIAAPVVQAAITDNNTADILVLDETGLNPVGTLAVDETGALGTFTLKLTSQPTANVVVVLASGDSTEGAVSPGSIAFNSTDWATPKSVTVTGVDDRILDGTVTWQVVTNAALSSDQGYNSVDPADVDVQTVDNDVAGLQVNTIGGLTTNEAGATASFQVALLAQPATGASVTVVVTSGDTGEIAAPAPLVFTDATWSTFQTVTLTGVDDDLDDGDVLVTIALAVDGTVSGRDPDFDAVTASVNVTNTDLDTPSIAVTPTSGLTTTETGGTAAITVVLSCQPTATVTIPVASTLVSEGTLAFDQIVFTSTKDQVVSVASRVATAGWNVPVTVTVTGQDDSAVDALHAYQVQFGATTTTDLAFTADPPDVALANVDDELPVVVTIDDSSLAEGGGSALVSIVLAGPPAGSATVIVPVSLTGSLQAALSLGSVTFTNADWNVPQTVQVTPVADGVADGTASIHVVIGALISSDGVFNGYDAADLPITIADQDVVEVRFAPASGLVVSEQGDTATVAVRLGSLPAADVQVTVAPAAGEVAVSPASLTFTSTTWNVTQDLTLTGLDDAVADGTQTVTLAVTVTSGDSDYAGLVVPGLGVANLDDDTPGLLVLSGGGSLAVTEGGAGDALSVRLASAPVADVTVTVASGPQLTANPASLVFTPADWATAQAVTVMAVDDAVMEGAHTGTVTCTAGSADTTYQGLVVATSVGITDDDAVGIQVSPVAGLATTEAGGTAAFAISLTSQPSADVVIPLAADLPGEVGLSATTLTFTTGNWNTPQTVTITGQDDALDDGDRMAVVAVQPASSADGAYHLLDGSDVSVLNRDNDAAGVVFSPATGLITSEAGGTVALQVVLAAQPAADVTVTLTSTNGAEALVASPLTFTPGNWSTAQTATVTGQDDAVADGDAAFQINALTASSDPAYVNRSTQASGINQDDETPGLLFSFPDGALALDEAGPMGRRVVIALRSMPSAAVTVAITGDAGQVTLSSASLTFADLTPQEVLITAIDDASAEGLMVLPFTIATTSADTAYNGLSSSAVSATVADNDVPGLVLTGATGLTTTEAGGTATFTVALASAPLAQVTIALSSSDAAQGTVSPSALVFTPGDWSTPQAVTVTGADGNGAEDGDVGYRIITASVVGVNTTEPYHGRDFDDVLVVNRVVDNPPTLAALGNVAIAEDAGAQTVTLTSIGSGQAAEDQTLVVTAVTSDAAVTGPVTVTYDSPATSGTLAFTPPAQAFGTATITVSVSDGMTTVDRPFTVTVTSVNDLPVATANAAMTVSLRGTGLLSPSSLAATDIETGASALVFRVMLVPGGGALTVSGTTVVNNGLFTQADLAAGLIRYTHGGGGGVSDGFTFRIEDADGGISTPDVFQIAIDRAAPDVQVEPTLPASLTFIEDDSPLLLAEQSTVVDADNPSYDQAQLRVSVAAGGAVGDELAITPRTTPQGVLAVAGGVVTLDGVTVATVSGGTGGVDLLVTGATGATPMQFQAMLQSLTYTCTSQDPVAGNRVFTVRVTDPDGSTSGAIPLRPVAVVAVNDAPVLSAVTSSTRPGLAVSGMVTATDPDSAAITFTLVTPPNQGNVTLDAGTGAFTYTPATGRAGTDTFVVAGMDDSGTSTDTAVSLTVTVVVAGADVQAGPQVPASLVMTEGDGPLVLADQTQVADLVTSSYLNAQIRVSVTPGGMPGDLLAVAPGVSALGVVTVMSGSVSLDGVVVATVTGGASTDLVLTGTSAATPAIFQVLAQGLTYVTTADAPTEGTRTFQITITDPAGVETIVPLRPVEVVSVNDTPTIVAPVAVTSANRAISARITVTDPDSPSTQLSLVTPPVKGTLTLDESTGNFTYTPAPGLSGLDTFVVTATDGVGVSAPYMVNVAVTGTGNTQRPWLTSDPPMEAQAGEVLRFEVKVDPRDLPSGYVLSFAVDNAPAGLVITQDSPTSAVVTWTAAASSSNHVLFTITATDATSGTMATQPVTLQVLPAPIGGV